MEDRMSYYLNKNRNINRGYRNLDVWKEAIELFGLVRKKLKGLNTISLKLKGQIEDSALSVPSNIAEEYCRRFLKENIQHNSFALASLGENYTQIFSLVNSEDIDYEWFEIYDSKHYSLENKLINLNKSFIKKLTNKEEWKNDYIIKEMAENYEIEL